MSNIGFIFAGGTLTLTLKGHPYNVHPENPHMEEIKELLEDGAHLSDEEKEERLLELVRPRTDVIRAAAKKTVGMEDVEVEHGVVTVHGEEIHNSLTEKILEMYESGWDHTPLVRFMVNLSENPSEDSKKQLFDFLAVSGMPLTPDGCFLAYKGVKTNFWDQHTGRTFQYMPGKVIEMPREQVCADPSIACAAGIHVGTLSYAQGFSTITLLLKVNPRDAVSVPRDHNCAKLRVCRAEVVRVYEGDKALARPSYDEEDIQDENLLQADDDYRRLKDDGVVVKQKTFDDLFEEYSALNRDEVCRMAATEGFFISTNEARDMGKAFVVSTLANRGIPYNDARRDVLAKLAVRRGLFSTERSALRKGRNNIIEALQEDVEQRLIALQGGADANA